MDRSKNTEITNVELAQETPEDGASCIKGSRAAARGDSVVTMQYRQHQDGPMHQTLPSVLGHLRGEKDPLGSPKAQPVREAHGGPKVPRVSKPQG